MGLPKAVNLCGSPSSTQLVRLTDPSQQFRVDCFCPAQLQVKMPAILRYLLRFENAGTLYTSRRFDGQNQIVFARTHSHKGRVAHQVNRGLFEFLAKWANGRY